MSKKTKVKNNDKSGTQEIVRNINVTSFGELEIGEEVIVGAKISRYQMKESKYGAQPLFFGQCTAKCGDRILQAPKCYLPNVIGEPLVMALDQREADDAKAEIHIVVKLWKKEVEKSVSRVGYIWAAELLKAPAVKTENPLALLEV